MDKKVISTFEKIISVCKEDGCDFVDLTFEDAEQILALLKEQESIIESLKSDLHETLEVVSGRLNVVRCKDCRHQNWVNAETGCIVCKFGRGTNAPDWFCADGERK